MTAPIRDMAELVEALRCAQIDRDISYETIEHICGMKGGTATKYLAPDPPKNLGPISTFDIAFSLGKALALVDDVEAIKVVRKHWKRRSVRGGAAIQMRKAVASASGLSIAGETPKSLSGQANLTRKELLKLWGQMGGKASAKRRMKTMKKRARQQIAAHAARKRWEKYRSARS